jgi:uncharacterized protein (TIGR00369 family)
MLRPVPQEGQLIARGRLVHGGRQLGLSEVFVTDNLGRLITHGTSRCAILPPAQDIPAPPREIVPTACHEEDWIPPYQRPTQGIVLDQKIFDSMSGLDTMRSCVTGDLPLPPVSRLIGVYPVQADEGSCSFALRASGWHTSPTGLVMGGVTACLADLALACAIQTTVPAGVAYAPTDLRVQFLRPAPADGRLVALILPGRRADLTDGPPLG